MTYAETKEIGATSIIYTTFHGTGNYTANDREQNPATGNEFFTPEQARQRIEDLQHRGYLHDAEYWQSPRLNTYTYELWPDATEYLDDLIDDEREGRI